MRNGVHASPSMAAESWGLAAAASLAAALLVYLGPAGTGLRRARLSALLVALYTVAATQPLRLTLLAAVVVELGVALATVRWAQDQWLEAFIGRSGLATAAGVLGTNVRHRRALLASLH